jgi:hypothetical protein
VCQYRPVFDRPGQFRGFARYLSRVACLAPGDQTRAKGCEALGCCRAARAVVKCGQPAYALYGITQLPLTLDKTAAALEHEGCRWPTAAP